MKGGQQKMLLCNCICAWQPVRVVHGDGHIRSLTPPVTVGEVLKCHPHHFVCEPTSTGPPLHHSGMLPFDMELEEGRVYLLLPLPRLLPHLASSTFPNPPSCPCFTDAGRNAGRDAGAPKLYVEKTFTADEPCTRDPDFQGQLLVVTKSERKWSPKWSPKLRHRIANSKLVRSLVRMSRRFMLPGRLLHPVLHRFSFRRGEKNNRVASKGSSSSSVVGKSVQSRNRWRPGLECISEVDLLTELLTRDSEFVVTETINLQSQSEDSSDVGSAG